MRISFFCWVMHEQSIIDEITAALDTSRCRIVKISQLADEPTLRHRLSSDVAQGIRAADVIDRSMARIHMYGQLRSYSRSSFLHFGQTMIPSPFLRFYSTSFTVRAYHTAAILARQNQKKVPASLSRRNIFLIY